MFDFLADALAFFYELPIPGVYHSYGGSIIMLTLAINLVLLPLTLKGTRSMMQMQRLQPEMKALQAKYKDDREKLNQEMMAFYKENSINPVGGCLPLLLQLPVFFILYQVLRGLTNKPDGSETFDPKYLDQSTELYQSLSNHTEMLWLGTIDLSESAANVFSSEGFLTALPYFVLIGVVLVSSYIQQKQVSSRNPDSQTNAQQKMLLRIMPGFFALISYSLPAALTLYFATSNIFRMGQQELISRTMYRNKDDGSSNGKSGSKAGEKAEKGDKGDKAGSGTSKSNGSNGSGSESGLRALFKPGSSEPAEEPKPEGKGRPTPKRSEATGRSSSGSKAKPKSKSNKPKRSGGGRATPAGSLPQPRPRKKKRK